MNSMSRCMQKRFGFFGRGSIAAASRLVCLRPVRAKHRVCVIKYSRCLAALCSCAIAAGSVQSQGAAESQSAADAQAKLQALRGRIAQMTDRIGLELKERDALSTRLRDADLGITAERRQLEALDAQAQAAERQRAQLHAEQARLRDALDAERAELAAQVRAQYMMGGGDERGRL